MLHNVFVCIVVTLECDQVIKQYKIPELRYLKKIITAETCDFSTHIIPPVTIVTEHKIQSFTHLKKKFNAKLLIMSKGY